MFALSGLAVDYTDCTSAVSPRYETKQSDSEFPSNAVI